MSASQTRIMCSEFLEFLNVTGSPYHSVSASERFLSSKNFERLSEYDSWELKRGGRYFVSIRGSAILGFIISKQWEAQSGRFVAVGSHTDSPCLRLRPNHQVQSEGYGLIGLQLYGGGLWHTWFDRGLGFAGKVCSQDATGKLNEHLVRISRPVAMVPSLAIHLQDATERAAFKIDKETHLRAILHAPQSGTQQQQQQQQPAAAATSATNENTKQDDQDVLKNIVAGELKIEADDIRAMDLCFFEASPARTWGANNEFIEAGRLDNLASVWASVRALAAVDERKLGNQISLIVAWDHEEVGSGSCVGANGKMLENLLTRIIAGVARQEVKSGNAGGGGSPVLLSEILQRSFLVSADGAHGVHPNYARRHQDQHKPILNRGVVVKVNANQRYCTDVVGLALMQQVAKATGTCVQNFVVRNDSPCGSTIGPLATSALGVHGIDIGIPMWAMHSVRESAGSDDVIALTKQIEHLLVEAPLQIQ